MNLTVYYLATTVMIIVLITLKTLKTMYLSYLGQATVNNAGINLALHHLANVIVALHEKAKGTRSHIPYRDSTLTMLLKDSLGG